MVGIDFEAYYFEEGGGNLDNGGNSPLQGGVKFLLKTKQIVNFFQNFHKLSSKFPIKFIENLLYKFY